MRIGDILRAVFGLRSDPNCKPVLPRAPEAPRKPRRPEAPRGGVIEKVEYDGAIVVISTPDTTSATLPDRPHRGLSQMQGVVSNGHPAPEIVSNGRISLSGAQIVTQGATYIEIKERMHTLVIVDADIGKEGKVRGGSVFFDGKAVPPNEKGVVNLADIPVLGWRFQGGQKQKAPKPAGP